MSRLSLEKKEQILILRFFKSLRQKDFESGNYCFLAVNVGGVLKIAMVMMTKNFFVKALKYWPKDQGISIYWADKTLWQNLQELPMIDLEQIVAISDNWSKINWFRQLSFN
jgi:hypothetical protein